MCFQCVWKKRFVYLQGEQLKPETAGQRAGTSNSAKNQLPGRTSHRRRAHAGAGLRCAREMGSLVVAMATSPSERALLGSDAAGVSACFNMEHGMGPQSLEMERNRTAEGEGVCFKADPWEELRRGGGTSHALSWGKSQLPPKSPAGRIGSKARRRHKSVTKGSHAGRWDPARGPEPGWAVGPSSPPHPA